MSKISENTNSINDNRAPRFRRIFCADIAGDFGEYTPVVTSNFSSSGIAIIGDSCLQPGDPTILRVAPELELNATVVWRKGRRLGLRFKREVSLIEMLEIQMSVRALRQSRSPNDTQ